MPKSHSKLPGMRQNYERFLAASIALIDDDREAQWYGPWQCALQLLFWNTHTKKSTTVTVPQMPVVHSLDGPVESASDESENDGDHTFTGNVTEDMDGGRTGSEDCSDEEDGVLPVFPKPVQSSADHTDARTQVQPPGEFSDSFRHPRRAHRTVAKPKQSKVWRKTKRPQDMTGDVGPQGTTEDELQDTTEDGEELQAMTELTPDEGQQTTTKGSQTPTKASQISAKKKKMARSMRIPDFVQVLYNCVGVPSTERGRQRHLEVDKKRIILIVEIKPRARPGLEWTILFATEKQTCSHAYHAFDEDSKMKTLGVIIGIGNMWTYIEYTRDDLSPAPATWSAHKDRDYEPTPEMKKAEKRRRQRQTKTRSLFLHEIFDGKIMIRLGDESGLTEQSREAFKQIAKRLKDLHKDMW